MLSIKKLKKIYSKGDISVEALAGIDISFEKKEFTAICGPSGSGKTTLLNIVGTLDTPTEGSIHLNDDDYTNKSEKELSLLRREKFGFVFQTYNLVPVLSVYENVELVLRLLNFTDAERKEKTEKILERVGLIDMKDRRPSELSGGQQQRVSIARALVKEPQLVLADEPTANLDSKTGTEIINLMKEMNEESDVTFIFSTHDQLIMNQAKRLIKLKDGKIVEN